MLFFTQLLKNPKHWLALILPLLLWAAPGRAVDWVVTNSADSGSGSLRATIAGAGSGDTISFSSSMSGQTIYLTSGSLLIERQNLTIDGGGLGVSVDGGGKSPVLCITNSDVIVDSVVLTNGNNPHFGDGGGIVLDSGTLLLVDSTLSGNYSAGDGGAIFANNGTILTVRNCTLSGNSAASSGSGISSIGGTLTITDSSISSNSSSLSGNNSAGIYTTAGTLSASNCVFSGNFNGTNGAGGAIWNQLGTVSFNHCTFSGNSSLGGGAILNQSDPFSSNLPPQKGLMTMTNCTISGNSGSSASMFNSGTLILVNCTVSGNSAHSSSPGGGIFNQSSARITLINCTVSGNSAVQAAGIYNDNASGLLLTNTIIAGNTVFFSPADLYGDYSGANNFIGGNAELAPLGNYGGPMQTMVPLYGSPVIDAGTDAVTNFLASDQRGYPRISGPHVDIGAVEGQYAPTNNPPLLKNISQAGNEFQFGFTNPPHPDFTVQTSPDPALPLADWTPLGSVTEISSGQYQFTDTSATNQAQFYNVVSP